MRGSVNLNAPSYLPALIGTDKPGNSLLASLYGHAAPVQATVDPISALEQARNGEARQIALIAADPQVKRDIAQFTQALAEAETLVQLVADPAALKVLLAATGLSHQPGDTTQALRELLSNPREFSAMADPRWLRLTDASSFAADRMSGLRTPSSIAAIAGLYVDALWRASLDRTTPGLSNALDFQQRAAAITSADQIFADPVFRVVIATALDIPAQVAFLTAETRQQAIATRIDLTRFTDPAFVTQIAHRYLIAAQRNAGQNPGAPQPAG
jgi:hypothetical protein